MTLILAVLLSLGFSVTSFAGIATTAHDLTVGSSNLETTGLQASQICVYCHTPHKAIVSGDIDYNPLWNLTVMSESYTGYTSSTFSAEGDTAVFNDPLAGPSRLCMSCHDGTIGIDSALSATVTTNVITAPAKIIGDSDANTLASDHPIGFPYPALTADVDEIYSAETVALSFGDFLYNDGTDDLMTCASCHNVHDNTEGKFLLVNNSGSALCLTCHNK